MPRLRYNRYTSKVAHIVRQLQLQRSLSQFTFILCPLKMTRQHTILQADFLGYRAEHALSTSDSASVIGVTSRGIFLKTNVDWIIFLSFENFRGPMTINLLGDVSPLKNLTQGELVQVSSNLITVPRHNFRFTLDSTSIWQPLVVEPGTYDPKNLISRLIAFAQDAYANKAGAGLSGTLPALLDFSNEKDVASDNDVLKFHNRIQCSDLVESLGILENLVGRGSGLTPAGDDFVIGLLLTLNRWHTVLDYIDLPNINKQLVETAYAKTTTLSANLVECAAEGQADERLIAAIDFLMTGEGDREQILAELLNWGNSSGVDALVGMVVVLTDVA